MKASKPRKKAKSDPDTVSVRSKITAILRGAFILKHLPTEVKGKDSQAFQAILRAFKECIKDKGYRDKSFQEISRNYNFALQIKHYELAVIYLMLMRMILIEENAKNDARNVGKTAKYIIENSMLEDEEMLV